MFLPRNISGEAVQAIATLFLLFPYIGNLLCLNFGLIFGVTPSHIQLYQSENSPLNEKCTQENAVWIASNVFGGAAIGCIIPGRLADVMGPKSVLLLSGILQICGWFCIHFGYGLYHIHASRIFIGLTAGAAFSVLPMYIREISKDNGSYLTTFINLFSALGIFLGFLLGHFVSYACTIYVGLGIAMTFTMLFPFVQESPIYYLRQSDMTNMEKSLRWFRGIRTVDDHENSNFREEVRAMRSLSVVIEEAYNDISIEMYFRSWKAILACILIALSIHTTGVYLIFNYYYELFNCNSSNTVFILAGAQILGAILSFYLAKNADYSLVFRISLAVCSISLIFASFLTNCEHVYEFWTNIIGNNDWLLIGTLSLHTFAANAGIFPIAKILYRLMLQKHLQFGVTTIVLAFSWLTACLMIHSFHNYMQILSFSQLLLVLGGSCLVIAIFAFFFIREDYYYRPPPKSIVSNWSMDSGSDINIGHI